MYCRSNSSISNKYVVIWSNVYSRWMKSNLTTVLLLNLIFLSGCVVTPSPSVLFPPNFRGAESHIPKDLLARLEADKGCCVTWADVESTPLRKGDEITYTHDNSLPIIELHSGISYVKLFSVSEINKLQLKIKSYFVSADGRNDAMVMFYPGILIMNEEFSEIHRIEYGDLIYYGQLMVKPIGNDLSEIDGGTMSLSVENRDNFDYQYMAFYFPQYRLGQLFSFCSGRQNFKYTCPGVVIPSDVEHLCHHVPFAPIGKLQVKRLPN